MFTWKPIYNELAEALLPFRNRQPELVAVLADLKRTGTKTIFLDDYSTDGTEAPLAEIDPFTFFASFNRNIKDEHRIAHLVAFKKKFGLAATVPGDFNGIPLVDNQRSWFFAFQKDRKPDDIESLWKLATQVSGGGVESVTPDLFARCLDINPVGVAKLTIGMFWLNPASFLPADSKTKAYGNTKGVHTEPKDFQTYAQWLNEMTQQFGANYPQISHDAHLFSEANASDKQPLPLKETAPPISKRRYWTLAAGEGGEMWEDFFRNGIAAIGWDELGDLTAYKNKDELRAKLKELWPADTDKKNDTHGCWQFAHEIAVGDIIFAKHGFSSLLGYGIVESAYIFDDHRPHYQHTHKVKWHAKGQWEMPKDSKMALKTLTDITGYGVFPKPGLSRLLPTASVLRLSFIPAPTQNPRKSTSRKLKNGTATV